MVGKLLGGASEPSGEWDDGEAGGHKNEDVGGGRKKFQQDGGGDEDQKDVEHIEADFRIITRQAPTGLGSPLVQRRTSRRNTICTPAFYRRSASAGPQKKDRFGSPSKDCMAVPGSELE